MTIRTALFVPADQPRKLARALGCDADAIIVDLEDAVAPECKAQARAATAELVRPADGPALLVRVNSPLTEEGARDLRLLADLQVDGIVVPKATLDAIAAIGESRHELIALVETAEGLAQARRLAVSPRVTRLQLGSVDLALELGLPAVGGQPVIDHARIELVLASALAGLDGPLDGVHLQLDDAPGLLEATRKAHGLGMGGKTCVHPAQLSVVRETFAPTEGELAWARRVVAAFREGLATGQAVVGLDGSMVDLPVARRAQRLLADAGEDAQPDLGAETAGRRHDAR
jgi:citrate lyase subunit beta / citryl-CoA lyase